MENVSGMAMTVATDLREDVTTDPERLILEITIGLTIKLKLTLVFYAVILSPMYVITFANPKGGSGKTTSAMLLAEQIYIAGGSVAILDLDLNANIVAWSQSRQKEGRNVPFSVHARPQAEETVALIDELTNEAEYLIIDLEGSRDQIVTFALSRTDLCIIPLDGSPMEARQAAQAVRPRANNIKHDSQSYSICASIHADKCRFSNHG